MTRSLGDFYAHYHGVTHEPETRVLTFASLRDRGVPRPRLLLASDGVWDLWTFDEVASKLWDHESQAESQPGGGDGGLRLQQFATRLCDETRAKGEDYFGEGADNLTAVLLDLEAYSRTSS